MIRKINRRYRFTIDLFASDRNTKCKKIFSNFYCAGTFDIDALSHSWEDEVVIWICPPIRKLIKIVRRLKTSKVSGVIFIPEWKTADNWTEIFDKETQLNWPLQSVETYRPNIIQGTLKYRSPFTGRAKFNFLAIDFDSH